MSDLVARLRLEATGGDQAARQVERLEDALRDTGAAGSTAEQGARRAAAGIDQMAASADRAADEMQSLAAAAKADVALGFAGQMRGAAAANDHVGKTVKLTSHELLNLSRQFADVGVTAAMGMNPLMILVQQGPQIAETLAMTSARGMSMTQNFGAMAAAGWAAIAPLAPFALGAAAVAAVVGGGLLIATNELNKEHKDLAGTLGLTDEQLKKVKNTGITTGDVLKGTFTYAGEAIREAFGPQIEWVKETADSAYELIVDGAKATVQGLVGGFGYGVGAIRALFANLPAVIQDYLTTGANLGIAAIEYLVNAAVSEINELIAGVNLVARVVGLPIQAPLLDKVSFARLANEHKGAMRSVHEAGLEGARDAQAGLGRVYEGATAAILRSAEARIREEAGTAKATKATKENTKAVRENLEAVKLLAADLKTLVDLTKPEAAERYDARGLIPTAESIGAAFEGMREEIADLAQYMEDRFVYSGELAFGDIADYAEQELRRAVYQALLAKPIQIIIDAVVRGLPGGGAGLGGLGMVGVIAGLGMVAGSVIGGRTGRAISGGAQIAGLGAALGSGLGSAAAAGLLGTGGLAAGAASLAPLLGPIGLAAGALYAAAKLFNIGGKPSNKGAGYDLITGQLSGDKRNEETERAVTSAAEAIRAATELLGSQGVTPGATVNGLVIGTRDPSQIYMSDGRTVTSAVGDAAAAVDAAMRAMLQGATYQNEVQKTLVEGMLAAGKGFEEITEALASYAQAQDLVRGIDDAILALTDPKAWAVEELKRAQQDQRDALKAAADAGYLTAEQFSLASEKLTTLEGLQLEETLKRFQDAVAGAAEALELQRSVEDRILELTNPNAFRVKRINDDIADRAAEAQPLIEAGLLPPEFLAQLEQLRQLELNAFFTELASEVDETARAFQSARPRLLAWLDELRAGPASELSPKAALTEALKQYEAQLAKAQAGDPTAIGNITAYADRLIAADRAATSSASERLARRDRIAGDIEGLAGRGLAAEQSPAAAIASLQPSLATLAQTASAELATLSPQGKAVVIANLPSMQAMYGDVLTSQTDRLVAANDRSREEIVAAVSAMAARTEAAFSALADQLDGALAAAAESGAAQAAALREGLDELAREQRLADTYNRMRRAS